MKQGTSGCGGCRDYTIASSQSTAVGKEKNKIRTCKSDSVAEKIRSFKF
jgi:hypothetical protein